MQQIKSRFGVVVVYSVSSLALLGAATALVLTFRDRESNREEFSKAQEANRTIELHLTQLEKQLGTQLHKMQEESDDRHKKLAAEFQSAVEKQRLNSETQIAKLTENLSQQSSKQTENLNSKFEQENALRAAVDEKLNSMKAAMENLSGDLELLKALSKKNQAAPVAAADTAKPSIPGWDEALKQLKDENPTTRWKAVSELAKLGDEKAVPHLLPMLKDADLYVRNNAALTLGELNAKAAVDELIDALNDDEQVVRDSAYTSLKKITKKNIQFDPLAKRKEERARSIHSWKDWWNANKTK